MKIKRGTLIIDKRNTCFYMGITKNRYLFRSIPLSSSRIYGAETIWMQPNEYMISTFGCEI